ncbi:hypothetical protein DFP73DRAFT_596073 [Morchella snyderi]|nr:hypothetical protein DFP73DRAFT_596073 [Morchella snyderi]
MGARSGFLFINEVARNTKISQQNTGIRVPESAETAGVQGDAPVIIDAGSSVRQKCAYLTDVDKTNLMKLCVEYQAEHRVGKKTAFWSMISEMLLQLEGGGLPVRLCDPQGTVRGLVGAMRATLKNQERESGIVQEETYEFVGTPGKERRLGDAEEEDSEIEFEELDVSEGTESPRLGGRKRRKGKGPDIDDSKKNIELLVGAVDRLGESMVAAAAVSSSNENQTSE